MGPEPRMHPYVLYPFLFKKKKTGLTYSLTVISWIRCVVQLVRQRPLFAFEISAFTVPPLLFENGPYWSTSEDYFERHLTKYSQAVS